MSVSEWLRPWRLSNLWETMNMNGKVYGVACLMAAWLSLLGGVQAAGLFPAEGETIAVKVEKSFHGDAFEYTMKLKEKTPFYTLYYLEYPGNAGRDHFGTIYAHYYVPADLKSDSTPRPGAVCLHILGGDGSLTNMICAHLATNGIPAMMCYMPMFGSRTPFGGRSQMLAQPNACRLLGEAIRQGPEDAIRTIDVMLTRAEVNPKKVNLLGTSMGGINGATVAGRDARVDKVILLLAGGHLDRIIGNSSETTKMREVINTAPPADRKFAEDAISAVDALANIGFQAERAARGKLKMYNAAEDEVIPAESVKELVEKSGMTGKNTMLQGLGHYTAIAALPQVLGEFVAFFRDDTVPERRAEPPVGDQEVVVKVFTQLLGLAKFSPEPGRAIFIDAVCTVKNKDKVIASGSLTLLRGDGRKLKVSLQSDTPIAGAIKQMSLGFSDYPWIVSGGGTIYKGELNASESSPASYVNNKIGMYQQMVVGVLTMAAGGMLEPLKQWCSVTMRHDASGSRHVSVVVKKTDVKLFLKGASSIPEKIIFVDGDTSGEVLFRQWQMDVPSEIAAFQPSGETTAKMVQVNQQDLDRMLAAVVNFLIK